MNLTFLTISNLLLLINHTLYPWFRRYIQQIYIYQISDQIYRHLYQLSWYIRLDQIL